MTRPLALAAAVAALGAAVPPSPPCPTRTCRPRRWPARMPAARHRPRALRVKGTTCHRARQVSHFWETHGRCVAGWSEKRYALPAGVEATGGTYINCRRGRARVFWAEAGE